MIFVILSLLFLSSCIDVDRNISNILKVDNNIELTESVPFNLDLVTNVNCKQGFYWCTYDKDTVVSMDRDTYEFLINGYERFKLYVYNGSYILTYY
jgi:hypothetical protein